MLPDIVIAVFLTLNLILSLGRNIYESKKFRGYEKDETAAREAILVFAAVFALVFHLESALYVIMFLLGAQSTLTDSVLQLRFPFDHLAQTAGIAIMIFGYILVFWSLRVLEYDRLTSRGPYGYVRHPQYVANFLLFGGFFLTLLNLIALLPLLAIPGIVRMANREERLLTKKYGDAYIRYQQKTGKFFPRIKAKPERKQ